MRTAGVQNFVLQVLVREREQDKTQKSFTAAVSVESSASLPRRQLRRQRASTELSRTLPGGLAQSLIAASSRRKRHAVAILRAGCDSHRRRRALGTATSRQTYGRRKVVPRERCLEEPSRRHGCASVVPVFASQLPISIRCGYFLLVALR